MQRFSAPRVQHLADLRWVNILIIAGLHLLCLLAPFFFHWSALIACAVLYFWGSCLGLTLGWHRMLAHRSFRPRRPIELFLAASGCINLQDSPAWWVGVHRRHHAHTDRGEDPHTPLVTLAWAHMGWVFKPLDFDARTYARDLLRDPGIARIDRLYWFFPLGLAVGLWAVGHFVFAAGLAWLVWAVAVRTVLVFHATWFVNSAAHKWGYRNFPTSDVSTNCWWSALLSWGEGWHNNHHADHRVAAHGLRWWEIDVTWWLIRAMEITGLCRDVVRPAQEQPATIPAVATPSLPPAADSAA